MRLAAMALVSALGLAVSAMPANATPNIPVLDEQQASNVVLVAGGCGRGFYPNRWGRCVPYRYGYRYPPRHRHYSYRPSYRYYSHQPRWSGYHYGGGYYPHSQYRYGY